MNTHRTETVVNPDGTLLLKDLPFQPGDVVEVFIQKHTSSPISKEQGAYSLRGTAIRYDEPTAPVAEDDWTALR